MTAEQLGFDDLPSAPVDAGTRLGELGKRLSVAPLSADCRAAFDRVLRAHIDAGATFSADDLRWALDAAQVPNKARGGLMSGALARGLIREVGVVRSTHERTHGKRISVYQGAAA